MLTRRLTVAAASLLVATGTSGLAQADDGPVVGDKGCAGQASYVTVCRQVPGKAPDAQPAGKPDKAKPGQGKPKPALCVVKKLDPQPSAGDPLWKDRKPGDGAIYTRVCPSQLGGSAVAGAAGGLPQTFWAQNAPAATVDPAVLAQQAVDKMLLKGPDININPKPSGRGVVGMPVWMATDQSQTTWGPSTASASGGGVTVTATAHVSQVVWDMGDGSKVTCAGPGTPYKKSFGLKRSPDCGHVFDHPSTDEPGSKFKVTATSTWVIDWQVTGGGGESGQLTEVRDSEVAVTIVESQAVNS